MMEYRIVQLTAVAATGVVVEAHWTLDHTEAGFSAHRYGSIGIPSDPTPLQFTTVTESQAIEALKDAMGPEAVAALEAGIIADCQAQASPPFIQGIPPSWVPAPAPPPPP